MNLTKHRDEQNTHTQGKSNWSVYIWLSNDKTYNSSCNLVLQEPALLTKHPLTAQISLFLKQYKTFGSKCLLNSRNVSWISCWPRSFLDGFGSQQSSFEEVEENLLPPFINTRFVLITIERCERLEWTPVFYRGNKWENLTAFMENVLKERRENFKA